MNPTSRWLVLGLITSAAFAFADVSVSNLEPQQPAPLQNAKGPADHSTLMHPDQLQTLVEIEAYVESTDGALHTLTTKDKEGHLITIQTNTTTRILDTQNHALNLTDLKAKDHVRVYYDRKTNLAQQIDRMPTVSEAILGR